MSALVDYLKDLYIKVKTNNFEWKNIHANNLIQNPIRGIYTDMYFERDGKYRYLKYSIEYCSRCDENGMCHPEEGAKYYVLHELSVSDLDKKFEIPEPARVFAWNENDSHIVNNFGRFRYVFDDVETAKSVVPRELMMILYPYTYILSDEEGKEWNDFLENFESKTNNE